MGTVCGGGALLTGSVHGGPGPFEGADALPAEGHVLLAGGQGVRLQQLSALLLPQHRVHRLQELLLAVRGAERREQDHARVRLGRETHEQFIRSDPHGLRRRTTKRLCFAYRFKFTTFWLHLV